MSIVADSDPVTYWIRELSNEVRIGEVRNLLPPTPADVPTVVRLVCVCVCFYCCCFDDAFMVTHCGSLF